LASGGLRLNPGRRDGSALSAALQQRILAVKGRVRDFAGLRIKGGTILLMGGAEVRTGAWMVRGTIATLEPVRLLPTFAYACAHNPVFLGLCARHLQPLGFHIPVEASEGAYQRFTGDTSMPGKGEILLWRQHGS
jgi:formylmethanofuran dehydrogenase subunit C